MTSDHGEVVVRDLGSTNGIRINGQRVEMGRLRPGDELSIAHIRYRLDTGQEHERTLVDPSDERHASSSEQRVVAQLTPSRLPPAPGASGEAENPLAAAVREMLPPGVADRCRIQVILQMQPEAAGEAVEPCRHDSSP
jgi:hypothetical protein